MAKSMHEFHPKLEKGDVFLHNSPYHGDSHPADHTLLMPVIDEQGEHHFTLFWRKPIRRILATPFPRPITARRGTYMRKVPLIFPAVQVVKNYETIEDIIRMCRMRIRVPDQWYGDFLAMLGCCLYRGTRITIYG